jgi:hypothetical protein
MTHASAVEGVVLTTFSNIFSNQSGIVRSLNASFKCTEKQTKSIVTVNLLDVRIHQYHKFRKLRTSCRNFAHAGIQISNRAHIYIHYDYLCANNNIISIIILCVHKLIVLGHSIVYFSKFLIEVPNLSMLYSHSESDENQRIKRPHSQKANKFS